MDNKTETPKIELYIIAKTVFLRLHIKDEDNKLTFQRECSSPIEAVMVKWYLENLFKEFK